MTLRVNFIVVIVLVSHKFNTAKKTNKKKRDKTENVLNEAFDLLVRNKTPEKFKQTFCKYSKKSSNSNDHKAGAA